MLEKSEINVAAFLGVPGGICFRPIGVQKALEAIWHNTGNLLFKYALSELVANPKKFVSLDVHPEGIKHWADVLVIPAANLINPEWDLTEWANFVECCDLPVCVIGLGAQAPLDCPSQLILYPGTERFLRIIAERCPKIGIRGYYTGEILSKLGIHNVAITGCPSNFINENISGENIESLIEEYSSATSLKWAYVVGMLDYGSIGLERLLFQWASSAGAEAIIQTHSELFKIILDEPLLDWELDRLNKINKTLQSSEHSYRDNAGRNLDFISYISEYGSFYSDARTWIDQSGSYDLVIGMRIHGIIAAIQAGKLGICIAHDARTWELAEIMGYPWISANDLMKQNSLEMLLSKIEFSSEKFNKNRAQLWLALVDVIQSSNLSINHSFVS